MPIYTTAPGGINLQSLATRQDVARYKPIVVDSYYDAARYPGRNAVDGSSKDDDSRWISANAPGTHSIEIDLERFYDLREVHFNTGFQHIGALDNYHVEYWDGSTWRTYVNKTSGNSNVAPRLFSMEQLGVESVRASKLRLSSTDWIKLYEIRAFDTL